MRILLIEDEKQIIDFLKPSLEAEYFAVDVATDGIEGSYLARTHNYDVVILDNGLPKKNGMTVCEEIRAAKKYMPIIMLSVDDEKDTKVRLLNTGADDYVVKPFSFEELIARIRALLRRPPEMGDDVLHIGDLTLDTQKQVVHRDGVYVKLTRKEFSLLEYLMRHVDIVLSRGMIMEHVWDMNADPFSNTIEAHIVSLRRKVDKGFGKKLIKTVSGRGYKIEE